MSVPNDMHKISLRELFQAIEAKCPESLYVTEVRNDAGAWVRYEDCKLVNVDGRFILTIDPVEGPQYHELDGFTWEYDESRYVPFAQS